jgi:hypothetical protein
MRKAYTKYFILFFICFAVVCGYFLCIETHTIYGDDMALYFGHFKAKNLWDVLNAYAPFGKFRPVAGLVNAFNVFVFDNNLHNYFLFNVGIQALIICVFTLIVDLVLQSFVLSSVVGCLVGLSRFAFYNITQVLNGGSSEGLAMLFFLGFLYFILKFLIETEVVSARRYKYLLCSLLWANLAMYTNERYVVLFVYIILVTFLYRSATQVGGKKKLIVCTLSVLSVLLHFTFKTGIAGIDYLPQVGSNLKEFSLDSAGNSIQAGLLSIIQLNYGDPRRVGADYGSVAIIHQFLLFVIVNLIAAVVILYAVQVYRSFEAKEAEQTRKFRVVLWLLLLFVLSLLPVVSMARLELRWLQAPFAVFILLFCVLYANITTTHKVAMRALFVLFIIHFFISDYNYLSHVDGSFYTKRSEWISSVFGDAAKNGLIRSNTTNLFVLEDRRDKTIEKELSWTLADGKVFSFYQKNSKKIHYIDNNRFSDKEQLPGILNLNPATDQVVRFDGDIHDVTSQVIDERDSVVKERDMK